MASFQFGNVVVVEERLLGVIVKSWSDGRHDVYVRSYSGIREYLGKYIQHYVYSKELNLEEREFYAR